MPRKRKNQSTKTEGDKRQWKEADVGDSIEILPMTLQDEIEQPTAGTSTNRYMDFESILRESGALDSTITPSQVFSSDNVLEEINLICCGGILAAGVDGMVTSLLF